MEAKKTEDLEKALEKTWLESNGVITAIDMLNKAGLDNNLRVLYYMGEEIFGYGAGVYVKKYIYLITKQRTSSGIPSYGFFKYDLTEDGTGGNNKLKGCVSVIRCNEGNKLHEDYINFKDLLYELSMFRETCNEDNSKELLRLIRKVFDPNNNSKPWDEHDNYCQIQTYLFSNVCYSYTSYEEARLIEEPVKGCVSANDFLPKEDVVFRAANYQFTKDIMTEHPKHGGYEAHYMPVNYNKYWNTLYVTDTVGCISLRLPVKNGNEEECNVGLFNETLKYSIANNEIKLESLSWYQDGKDARDSKVSLEVLSKSTEKCKGLPEDIKGFFMFRIDNSLNKDVCLEEIVLLSFTNDYFSLQNDSERSVLNSVLKYLASQCKLDNVDFVTGFGHTTKKGKFVDPKMKYNLFNDPDIYRRTVHRIIKLLSDLGVE